MSKKNIFKSNNNFIKSANLSTKQLFIQINSKTSRWSINKILLQEYFQCHYFSNPQIQNLTKALTIARR